MGSRISNIFNKRYYREREVAINLPMLYSEHPYPLPWIELLWLFVHPRTHKKLG